MWPSNQMFKATHISPSKGILGVWVRWRGNDWGWWRQGPVFTPVYAPTHTHVHTHTRTNLYTHSHETMSVLVVTFFFCFSLFPKCRNCCESAFSGEASKRIHMLRPTELSCLLKSVGWWSSLSKTSSERAADVIWEELWSFVIISSPFFISSCCQTQTNISC